MQTSKIFTRSYSAPNVRQSLQQICNEFITVFSEDVRLNWVHEREATASFFRARRTSNVR